MSEPETRSAEEYLHAFHQHLDRSKALNQAMILMLAKARMQADVHALAMEVQPRLSPLQRLRQHLTRWLRFKPPASVASVRCTEFPWGIHGYYVVNDSLLAQTVPEVVQGKESSSHDQIDAVAAPVDSPTGTE